jgi:hypothetical protein
MEESLYRLVVVVTNATRKCKVVVEDKSIQNCVYGIENGAVKRRARGL